MRLFSFADGGDYKVGAQLEDKLVPLPFPNLEALISGGDSAFDRAKQELERGQNAIPLDKVRLRAPIRPGKIFCSGLNYRSHIGENPSAKFLQDPRFLVKISDAVIGPGEPILHPGEKFMVDYEVELAVVIGRPGIGITGDEAMEHVFGYTILQDVSARYIQFKDNNEDMGKNFDTFAPLGPCIVTKDEIPHPERLQLRLWINDELMQDGTNEDWCFPLPHVLSWLSTGITLRPSDVVSCGTPAGTGYFRKPQRFLKPGDVCRLEIPGIGVLENPVVASRLAG